MLYLAHKANKPTVKGRTVSGYQIRIIEYTHKRQQRFAVEVKNTRTNGAVSEPGFKSREAAQAWGENKVAHAAEDFFLK